MEKTPYLVSGEATCERLQTSQTQGLSIEEAKRRLAHYGLNQITTQKRISAWKVFFGQFQDFLILILLVAAVVSIGLGERTDGFLILTIVMAVALIGFFNEYKAERTIETLKNLVAIKAKVIRSGKTVEVDAKELVPGDIVELEEGQRVPADMRLIENFSLLTAEAALTGESQPVTKDAATLSKAVTLGDRLNMVYSGTSVASGKGKGVVVATGNQTEIGHIATLVEEANDEATPMQVKLDRLGKQMGYGILIICAVVFLVVFFLNQESQALPLARRLTFAFIAAVALAVAAIPEGLAFVVRISLALGARRMAARKALIRRLPAVEALGSTDTICCDKTGTLTRGEMTLRQIWTNDQLFEVSGSGYALEGEFTLDQKPLPDRKPLELILSLGVKCNNAKLQSNSVLGDPTEAALLAAAAKAGIGQVAQGRLDELPFTSDRKMMSTLYPDQSGYLVAVKGATEVVLSRCNRRIKNGNPVELDQVAREQIQDQNYKMSAQALRVLALAYKTSSVRPSGPKRMEAELVFVGLVGIMDPPREEIKSTIRTITHQAGIKVIMITGDHIETAKAVAREIGIEGEAITGTELDQFKPLDFDRQVENLAIYARVNPEHKIRIVKALKKHGHQVAMTGDGVNDAPAIKEANIGIAMGITGTDVAKEAADVILLDDHFNTIVAAIEEGRGIFDNVRKFVSYLLSANLAEVLIVTSGIMLFGRLILTAVQLLFINIVTDGLPAIALGSDPAEKNIMNYSPKRFQANIADARLWLEMLFFGVVMTILILVQFAYNLSSGDAAHAVAAAFTTTVIFELVRLISLRSNYKISWLSNPWLLVAIASSLSLQLLVVFVPTLSRHFGAAGLTAGDWQAIGLSSFTLFASVKLLRLWLGRGDVATRFRRTSQLTT